MTFRNSLALFFKTLIAAILVIVSGYILFFTPSGTTSEASSSIVLQIRLSNLRSINSSTTIGPIIESNVGSIVSSNNTSKFVNKTNIRNVTINNNIRKKEISHIITCSEMNLKVPTLPSCSSGSSMSIILKSKTNDGLYYGDRISYDTNDNPLHVNYSSSPEYIRAVKEYANWLNGEEIVNMCEIWDKYILVLGLNGLHQPLLATSNPELHILGGWAAGYSQSKRIDIHHAINILASPASAGAALHGIVTWHLVAWSERMQNDTNSKSAKEELWKYTLNHVCFMVDEHPQLYIHCLHAVGHAALIISVINSDPNTLKSIFYRCPSPPEISNSIAAKVEIAAAEICDHANYYTFMPVSAQRREQESFVCADGLYMLYFEQRDFMLKNRGKYNEVGADLRMNWWEPCGQNSRFAAPCFEFLFRTGTAGRRIAGMLPLAPRSQEAPPPSKQEQWKANRILFPTLCLRSEIRIRNSANPKFITAEQQFLACVHAISQHLYEMKFPKQGVGFLDRCSSTATKQKVLNMTNNHDLPWISFPGSPSEPIFSFCAQSVLNIGFDKLLFLKRPQPTSNTNTETKIGKLKKIQRIQRISKALATKTVWNDRTIATWKACVAGIGTSASFFTAVDFIPCWSVKWTLCYDAIPRSESIDGSSGHLETFAPEIINTCLRLSLSRSERVDRRGYFSIWDTEALGFE
jgi:hypothetical protein